MCTFQRHGRVERILLLIDDDQVYKLITFLMRWKCVLCGRTFRHYPSGVLPYKHYLATSPAILCERYLQEPGATYRQVACSAGPLKKQPIFYAGGVAGKESSERQKALEQPRVLAHSTLWQWMGFLAALWELVRPRSERRQITADQFDLSPWRMAPQHYRSEERRQILLQAALTLAVVTHEKYSTDFKTLSGGP